MMSFAPNNPPPPKQPDCLGIKDPKTGAITEVTNRDGRQVRVPDTDTRGNPYDMNAGIMQARGHSVAPGALMLKGALWTGLDAFWFRNQVKHEGPWDFKQLGDPLYEDFGNFHYGVVGAAAGFPRKTLYQQAGAAQKRDPAGSSPSWDVPPYYGDDPRDHFNIELGINSYDPNNDYSANPTYVKIPCRDSFP